MDTPKVATPENIYTSVIFLYINQILNVGTKRQLRNEDLLPLPENLLSSACFDNLKKSNSPNIQVTYCKESNALGILFWRCYGNTFLVLGLFVLVNTLLGFGGPLLIGAVVQYIEDKPDIHDLVNGLSLVIALVLIFTLSSISNVQYNLRCQLLQLQVKSALYRAVFAKAISTTVHEWSLLSNNSESQVSNYNL